VPVLTFSRKAAQVLSQLAAGISTGDAR